MFLLPAIHRDDIQWASEALGLSPTAFSGVDGNDPRAAVLLSNETLDIEACPGSGKTTLLFAKLAILARKWGSRRSGVCVLSHTNAARREIESSLGCSAEGAQLLSYPHFVGTIHAFVNEYLAIPWLRSLGYPIVAINDALCEEHRRRLLRLNIYSALRRHVEGKEENPDAASYVGSWSIASPDFSVLKNSGALLFSNPNAQSARQIRALVKQCTEDGFYKYEEMFMWANDLLNKYAGAVSAIRQRFPLLFIDEVQDNSESQSRILKRIFVEGNNPVIRQRYGDSNQAIYAHAQATGAQSDPFPLEDIRRDIPNSHRFGQQIAALSNPLALRPQNLQGLGPPTHMIRTDTAQKHAVLLFDDDSIANVLDCYGSYLSELFSEEELQVGTFTAVGAVHRPGDDTNLPRSVGHYWPEYDHELSYSEPRPKTFCQYIAAGWNNAGENGDVHAVVEQIAEGVLRAVRIVEPTTKLGQRKRKHRYILELLSEVPDLKNSYLSLVLQFISNEKEVTANEWREIWRPTILQVVETISEYEFDPTQLDEFFAWPTELAEPNISRRAHRRDNYYRYPEDDPVVSIRVGSIHSVKGETHTATLVLDTFFHEHQFSALKPWLRGENEGYRNERVRMRERLKQHYVAFTRPTHLLCIAMRDNLTPDDIHAFKGQGWQIGRVKNDSITEWL